MKKIQNLVLVLWTLALLLFVAFNWGLVQRVVEIHYLFMVFEVQLLAWLLLAAFAVPVVLRLLSGTEATTFRRRSEKDLTLVKAKAYDGLSAEFSRLGEQLQGRLEGLFQTLVEEKLANAQTPGGGKDSEKAADKETAGGKEAPEPAAEKSAGRKSKTKGA